MPSMQRSCQLFLLLLLCIRILNHQAEKGAHNWPYITYSISSKANMLLLKHFLPFSHVHREDELTFFVKEGKEFILWQHTGKTRP